MVSEDWGLVQPYTLYMVIRPVSGLNNTGYICDGYAANSSGSLLLFPNSFGIDAYAGNSVVDSDPSAVNFGIFDNKFYIITAVFNGAESFLQLNAGASISGDAGTTDPGGIRLCGRTTSGRTINYEMLELLVRAKADGPIERAIFQEGFADLHGIAL